MGQHMRFLYLSHRQAAKVPLSLCICAALIDHEIISTVILIPSTDLRKVAVSYKQKYVLEVLVNLVKLAQEKSVVRRTDHPHMTIAVDLGHKESNQAKKVLPEPLLLTYMKYR